MAKVLIADDDLEILELLKFTFENEKHQVITAVDGEEALKKAKEEKPDIIILDVNMPKLTGFEVCEKIREDSSTCLIPVIMLTSLTKPKDRITGIKLGADEYLGKPFETFEVLARVEGLLNRIKESISANPLTKLPGNTSIEKEIKRRIESKEVFSVMFIDADNFKAYNDKYSFEKGDNIIKLIAVILRSSIAELGNKNDFLGHLGGEDFVVVTTPDKVQVLAGKITNTFDSLIPCQYDEEVRTRGYVWGLDRQNKEVKFPLMSISAGIVNVEPGKFIHYSQIIDKAKIILTNAKQEPGSSYKIE
ncbi:MAG: response regulator [Endomicrobiales bacterium]|nr:response regulator [Endomicrobiales bacterium]